MTRLPVQVAHLPFHALRPLVVPRGVTGDDAARMARDTLRTYTATLGGSRHATWQDAWNAMTGAAPARPGILTVHVTRCRTCHGRRTSFTGSSISRAVSRGLPPGTCPTCRGNGRVHDTARMVAHYADGPTGTDTDTPVAP